MLRNLYRSAWKIILSAVTFRLSKKMTVLLMSADAFADSHNACNFVDETNRTKFCIGDVLGKSFYAS